jgi:hypothetical protein
MLNSSSQGQKYFGSIETAKDVGISLRQLYHWVDALRVVRPAVHAHGKRAFRRFTNQDLSTLRKMNSLVEEDYTPRAAVRRVLSQKDAPANDELTDVPQK